jgi:hypothetical protein
MAAASSRLAIRVRLKAAAVNSDHIWLRSRPRYRNFRPPTVLIQPKISSTRFRTRWLIAYPACVVVRPLIALRWVGALVLRHVWSHPKLTAIAHEVFGVIALVRPHCAAPSSTTVPMQQLDRHLPFRSTVGLNPWSVADCIMLAPVSFR